jgi:hypothetical protein
MTKEEILKDLTEIMDDCDYITRRVQILKSNAKAVADALAYEARKEAAK